MCIGPSFPDLLGEDRAKAVPPEADRFVTDVDPAFVQDILNLAQAERVPDVVHHRQFDDFGAGFEVLERGGAGHIARLDHRPVRLKPSSSDRTARSPSGAAQAKFL